MQIALNASFLVFSSSTISTVPTAVAEWNSSVKLPSFGPLSGLQRVTADRNTLGLALRTSSFFPSVAQWNQKVFSSVRTRDRGNP